MGQAQILHSLDQNYVEIISRRLFNQVEIQPLSFSLQITVLREVDLSSKLQKVQITHNLRRSVPTNKVRKVIKNVN